MLVLVLTTALLQAAPCSEQALAALGDAAARMQEFDERGSIARLERAPGTCGDVAVAMSYLKGLAAARNAYRDGGSAESLAPVKEAIDALGRYGADQPGLAQIARLVLLAAAAAAQSERDEMAVFLDEALRQESIQMAARQPGAPIITAHQAAGDLWLQVHRFEEARRAYQKASEQLGSMPPIILGLARTAARLNDPSACTHYRRLLDWWGSFSGVPAEIAEARAYVAGRECQPRRR